MTTCVDGKYYNTDGNELKLDNLIFPVSGAEGNSLDPSSDGIRTITSNFDLRTDPTTG